MAKIGELFKTDDWKTEKHVPVIECDDEVTANEVFEVRISVGKEVDHPNTTEHHIRWIDLCFIPEGAKVPFQVGHFEFTAHGESTDGPNKGPVYTHHQAVASLKVAKGGTLLAASYCNIHGLWESSRDIAAG